MSASWRGGNDFAYLMQSILSSRRRRREGREYLNGFREIIVFSKLSTLAMSDSITFSLDEIRLKKMKGSLRPPSNKRSVIKIPNKVRGGRVERKRASESMEEFVRDKRSKEREN